MNIFCGIKLISLCAAAALLVQIAVANPSCKPRGVGDEGFTVSLYRYPYANLSAGAEQCYSDRYNDHFFDDNGYYHSFFNNFYPDYGFIGSANGITNLTMDLEVTEECTPTLGKLPSNYNFQEEFDISNFTMHIQGYYYAEMSGEYTIMAETGDAAYLALNFTSYDCCGVTQPYIVPSGKWPPFGDYDSTIIEADYQFKIVVYLQGGSYYSFEMVYVNMDSSASFNIGYKDPTGEFHNDFTGRVFQFEAEPEECPIGDSVYRTSLVSSYSGGPSGTSTTTGTSVGSDGYGTIRTTYTIFEYDAIETLSSSSAPSASSSAPSASSSKPSSSFSAPSASSSAPSASSSASSANSSTSSASSRSSFSSSGLIPSNGTVSSGTSINPSESSYLSSTDEPITSNSSNESIDTYTSETSTVSATTTATVTGTTTVTTECTEGDVTAPTTFSTATVTVTGPDGIATTETTYYVKTPATPSGAATNKYSNGTATRYETVFSTIYSYCSCSDVSIYSTDVVTVTTTNGNGNPEKVVQTTHYIQVPETMTVNADMGSAVAAALASKTTEGSIPKYYPITTGLSTYSGAASGLSNGIFTFAVGLLFAMIVA